MQLSIENVTPQCNRVTKNKNLPNNFEKIEQKLHCYTTIDKLIDKTIRRYITILFIILFYFKQSMIFLNQFH